MYPIECQKLLENDVPNDFCEGGSIIISPFGKVLAGPLWVDNGVLIANLDLEEIIQIKLDFDPVGHYNRPDIFKFEVLNQAAIYRESNENTMNN